MKFVTHFSAKLRHVKWQNLVLQGGKLWPLMHTMSFFSSHLVFSNTLTGALVVLTLILAQTPQKKQSKNSFFCDWPLLCGKFQSLRRFLPSSKKK